MKIKALYVEDLGDRLFDITDDGVISASDLFKSMGMTYKVDLVIPDTVRGITVSSIAPDGFRECGAIKTVDIHANITEIPDKAFEYCIFMTQVNIPESITSINYSAFHNCASIISITIPKNVTSIEKSAFLGCNKLTSIYIDRIINSISDAPWGAPYAAVNWLG